MTPQEIMDAIEEHHQWNYEDRGEKANFFGVDMREVYLSGIDLSSTELKWANLSEMDLTNVDFQYADLSNANLSNSDLSGANLSFANLFGANLEGANLNGARLRRTILNGTNLKAVNIGSAKLIVLALPEHMVYVHEDNIRVDAKQYSHEEVISMNSESSVWWKTYKDLIVSAIKTIRG